MAKILSLKENGPNSYNGFGLKFVKGTPRKVEDDTIAMKLVAEGFFDVEEIEMAEEDEAKLNKDPGSYPTPTPPASPQKGGAITTQTLKSGGLKGKGGRK